MNIATFAFKSAFRNRLRTALTALGVAVAVVAFLFLRTVVASFSAVVDNASENRVITHNKVSVTQQLPMSYAPRIQSVPGVEALTWAVWFGGVYRDPKDFFPKLAVDADSYLSMYPELLLTPGERASFLADRTGCIVGESLAVKYHLKVGDKLPIKGDIYPGTWDFNISGIYRGRDRGTDTGQMFFHWKYLDETRTSVTFKNSANLFIFRVADSKRIPQVARDIDTSFENSIAETRTENERAFFSSFLSMFGAVLTAVQLVSTVMMAVLALILGNTMAMSTRERTSEYGVMRSLGFKPNQIVRLVLAEGFIVAALGYAVGAAITPPLIGGFSQFGNKSFGMTELVLSADALVFAGLAALLGGVVATAVPAFRAGQLSIVDALRRVE